jgi:hypothetical protein
LSAAALVSVAALALGGCSLLGGSKNVAATKSASASTSSTPSTKSSYSPLAGPVEAASSLPKECSQMLTSAQLQAAFGAGVPIGDNYGSYAPLTSIGRTGRVACVFGVGLDSFGQQSSGMLEVSIATYNSASNAVGRAADTVQSDSNAGATEAAISVGGHPATIVVEQTAVGATSSAPTAGATSPTASSPATAATTAPATTAATSTAGGGETELVMADGNRTFVLQVPFTKLSAQQAVAPLTLLALDVYRNTLPAGSGSSTG